MNSLANYLDFILQTDQSFNLSPFFFNKIHIFLIFFIFIHCLFIALKLSTSHLFYHYILEKILLFRMDCLLSF